MSSESLLNNGKIIYEGWSNYLKKGPAVEELAKVRAEICSKCPHNGPEYSKFKAAILKDEIKEVEGYTCTHCNCPLSAKIRSVNETCPKKEW